MSAARSSVRGARSDLYSAVWARLYHLAPGKTTTMPDVVRALQKRHPGQVVYPTTVSRALERAEEAGLIRREGRPDRRKRSVWIREDWPDVVTIHALAGKQTDPRRVLTVLEALKALGYLERDDRGYRKAE